MTSILQLTPKVTHTRIHNHLYLQKRAWTNPSTPASSSKQKIVQPPAIKKIARFGLR